MEVERDIRPRSLDVLEDCRLKAKKRSIGAQTRRYLFRYGFSWACVSRELVCSQVATVLDYGSQYSPIGRHRASQNTARTCKGSGFKGFHDESSRGVCPGCFGHWDLETHFSMLKQNPPPPALLSPLRTITAGKQGAKSISRREHVDLCADINDSFLSFPRSPVILPLALFPSPFSFSTICISIPATLTRAHGDTASVFAADCFQEALKAELGWDLV